MVKSKKYSNRFKFQKATFKNIELSFRHTSDYNNKLHAQNNGKYSARHCISLYDSEFKLEYCHTWIVNVKYSIGSWV